MSCLHSILSNLQIVPADRRAWQTLAPFHYRSAALPPVDKIFALRTRDRRSALLPPDKLLGVIVYTYPLPNLIIRNRLLNFRYRGLARAHALRRLNREFRTIARVVIHPAFRGLGLGARLVRLTLPCLNVANIETLAAMGRVNPFFAHAGMTPFPMPPSPRARRLTAALADLNIHQHHCLSPPRLLDSLHQLSPVNRRLIHRELIRFAQSLTNSKFRKEKHHHELSLDLLTKVLNHLYNAPVYYLWKNPSLQKSVPPASPPLPHSMTYNP